MKKFLFLLLTLTLTVWPAAAFPKDADTDGGFVRGVWVSSVVNLDYPSAPGLSDAELRAEADEIINTCAEMGMNTVFFQVRPCADALYNSEIFPKSLYLKNESTYEDLTFDPLEYMVQRAHERGMELHAWINPYRVNRAGLDLESFSPDSPQRLHPEYLLRCGDGSYIFNPALREVRDLITSGVTEIADNYDVDGIHFDDYFYPDSSFDDSEFFAASGSDDLGEWRRENVNALVKQVSDALRSRGVTFGISPRGIWANDKDDPRGSDTNGGGSYNTIYCDSLRFIEEGWVDYICPQIYWEIGYDIADYGVLVKWWSEAVEGTGVKLYIGMADYRAEDAEEGSPWQGIDEAARQHELNKSYPAVRGEVHFRYGVLADNPELRGFYSKIYTSRPNVNELYRKLKENILLIVMNML